MNQFVLHHNNDEQELRLFPHIMEIGVIKNSAIRLDGFPCVADSGLKMYYIQEGKFEWRINKRLFILYPGDTAILLPGVELCNPNNVLEIGTFSWIHIRVEDDKHGNLTAGAWSSLSNEEYKDIGNILKADHLPVLQKFYDAGNLLKMIQAELFSREVGYCARVNHLLDEILIQVARQFTRISDPGRDFLKTFMELEQQLRRDLSRQWTVEEMAALAGMGTTLFNEKVKSYSGFSPLSYLINIRISEAIKLLKNPSISLTDIALDTGFYSSQHFSTTFKKLTGYTPSQFRKNHLRTK